MSDIHLSMEDVSQMTPNVEVKQENAEAARDESGTLSDSQDDAGAEHRIKADPDVDNVTPNAAAVEQDDPDLYHSALGLHTELDIPLDIVKEEPDDDDPGAAPLANLKRTDQTSGRVEEQSRETKRGVVDKLVEKNKIVGTGDKIDIKLHSNKQNSTSEPKGWLCDTCQKCFRLQSALVGHACKTVIFVYECNVCKINFRLKSDYIEHVRTHTHADDKPYVCNVCKKCFKKKACLNVHIRSHTSEKPYKCKVCSKSFSDNSYLKKHVRTHTGEKPYECNVCRKCFNDNSGLKIHVRTHTGEKPYECNVCKKRFNDNSGLKKHVRTHTGEKPYECNVCKKRFNRKSKLVNHIRTHTDKKP